MSKGMLAALLVSIVLAISLSFLPNQALERWGSKANHVDLSRDVPVTKMEGVVDQLGSLTLSSRLQKVVYEKEKLTVWLAVPTGRLQQDKPWEDIYKIAHRCLMEVPHLRQVIIQGVSLERPDKVQFTVVANSQQILNVPEPDQGSIAAFVQEHMKVVE